MPDERPPVLQYASPSSPSPAQTSPTLLFAGGVALANGIFTFALLLHGDLDILLGPACDCILTPALAAGIFYATAALKARLIGFKLVQRNSYTIFGLGIAAYSIPLLIGFVLDSITGGRWTGAILLTAIISGPAMGAWIAFQLPDAERG
jgi:hypothetical protein